MKNKPRIVIFLVILVLICGICSGGCAVSSYNEDEPESYETVSGRTLGASEACKGHALGVFNTIPAV